MGIISVVLAIESLKMSERVDNGGETHKRQVKGLEKYDENQERKKGTKVKQTII